MFPTDVGRFICPPSRIVKQRPINVFVLKYSGLLHRGMRCRKIACSVILVYLCELQPPTLCHRQMRITFFKVKKSRYVAVCIRDALIQLMLRMTTNTGCSRRFGIALKHGWESMWTRGYSVNRSWRTNAEHDMIYFQTFKIMYYSFRSRWTIPVSWFCSLLGKHYLCCANSWGLQGEFKITSFWERPVML